MLKDIHNKTGLALKGAALFAGLALFAATPQSYAAELELPNVSEVQYFSPEAQQYYAAGVAALDRVDYRNAYAMLAKAAALQPTAIRLNRITATLAVYHGRQSSAEEARDYYETALHSFNNILQVPTLSGEMRRDITNEMKNAQFERDNLAQRDVIREANGTTFMLDYNRRYAERPARPAGQTAAATPSTTLTQQMLSPFQQSAAMAQQQQMMGGMMGMGMDPAMMDPTMMGGQPGMMPGAQPGMMPGQPMPGQPGMMPGQPGGMPGQPAMF